MPDKKVKIPATSEDIFVEDICLKFNDDQWGSQHAPNSGALEASDFNTLQAYHFKEIKIPFHCDPSFLYYVAQTLTAVSSYSSTKSTGNAIPEEIDVFQDLIEDDDKTHTREDVYSEIFEISYMIPTPKNGQSKDFSLTEISIMIIDIIEIVAS